MGPRGAPQVPDLDRARGQTPPLGAVRLGIPPAPEEGLQVGPGVDPAGTFDAGRLVVIPVIRIETGAVTGLRWIAAASGLPAVQLLALGRTALQAFRG